MKKHPRTVSPRASLAAERLSRIRNHRAAIAAGEAHPNRAVEMQLEDDFAQVATPAERKRAGLSY